MVEFTSRKSSWATCNYSPVSLLAGSLHHFYLHIFSIHTHSFLETILVPFDLGCLQVERNLSFVKEKFQVECFYVAVRNSLSYRSGWALPQP